MSIGISTDGTKQKILETEPEKLNEAIQEKANSIGISRVKSLKGKNQLEQLKDLDEYGSLMQESIQEQKEKREHNTREKQRNHKIPFKVGLKRYLENIERKSKSEYEKRRIVFSDGGIDVLEKRIRMLPFRVLLKQINAGNQAGELLLPHERVEYKVVCVGDGVLDVKQGDKVVVEAYSGIEVVSGMDVYRIVAEGNLLAVLEG